MKFFHYARKKIDGNLPFTENAMNELEQVEDTLVKIFDLTIKSIKHRDMESIQQVVELEDKMDY